MVDKNLKISVIVPTYNRASSLNRLLKSLVCQNIAKKFYEVVVVNNNSSDNTREVVKKYKERIRYIFEPKQGLHFARHSGARTAKGKILAYTDDDAVCDKNWLINLLKVYRNKSVNCVGGKITIKWDTNPPRWVRQYEPILGALDYGPKSRFLKKNEFINGANFTIRKKVLFRMGGFNPDGINGDGETGLCKKLHRNNIRIVWAPQAMVHHIQKVKKNATLSDLKRRFANNAVAVSYASYKEKRFTVIQLIKRACVSFIYSFSYQMFSLMQRLEGEKSWRQRTFLAAYYFRKATYQLELIFKPELRKLVLRKNWLNYDKTTFK